jgi:hypothetical protein
MAREDAPVKIARALLALALGAVLPVGASVLYKSIDERGTVTFSDVPPPAGAQVIEQRMMGSSPSAPGYGAEASALAPATGLEEAFQLLDYDKALREANERVDLAERALAIARAGHAATHRPGLNQVGGLPPADAERVEFYKRDLRAARIALMELLRSRQLASGKAIK